MSKLYFIISDIEDGEIQVLPISPRPTPEVISLENESDSDKEQKSQQDSISILKSLSEEENSLFAQLNVLEEKKQEVMKHLKGTAEKISHYLFKNNFVFN